MVEYTLIAFLTSLAFGVALYGFNPQLMKDFFRAALGGTTQESGGTISIGPISE